jgi:hypothetical protein
MMNISTQIKRLKWWQYRRLKRLKRLIYQCFNDNETLNLADVSSWLDAKPSFAFIVLINQSSIETTRISLTRIRSKLSSYSLLFSIFLYCFNFRWLHILQKEWNRCLYFYVRVRITYKNDFIAIQKCVGGNKFLQFHIKSYFSRNQRNKYWWEQIADLLGDLSLSKQMFFKDFFYLTTVFIFEYYIQLKRIKLFLD